MAATFMERLLPAPLDGGFRMDGYWTWCGSAVKSRRDAKFHLFASRWPKGLPMFEGYILKSEIVRAIAERPEGPYRFVEKILPAGDASRWDGRMAHNPAIRLHAGIYYLFYIGSTYSSDPPESLAAGEERQLCDESYRNIRIGVATAESPEGPWTPKDEPVLSPRPGKWDSAIVTNPAPCILPDGTTHLYYRSNTPEGLRIGLATGPSPTGPYERLQDGPVMEGMDVEDPFVWREDGHFEMLAKDMSGAITGERHAGAHLRSSDGVNWEAIGKGYSRKTRFDDGSLVELGSLERPQILFDDAASPLCLFAAMADGPGGFRKASKTWNGAIPFKAREG